MKTFSIYKNIQGQYKAIKDGWNWVAFLFSWIWAFFTKQWALGCILLFANWGFGVVVLSHPEMSIFINLVNLGIAILLGLNGNKLLSDEAKKKGYKYKGQEEGDSPEGAINSYLEHMQGLKEMQGYEDMTPELPKKPKSQEKIIYDL